SWTSTIWGQSHDQDEWLSSMPCMHEASEREALSEQDPFLMLADLLNAPKTPGDWSIWSFSNRATITTLQGAILAQQGVTLTAYPLDPIDNIETFLERNQQSQAD